MTKSNKIKLTRFQRTLLENLVINTEVLRHGTSGPVQELITCGYIEKANVDGAEVFIVTDAGKDAVS